MVRGQREEELIQALETSFRKARIRGLCASRRIGGQTLSKSLSYKEFSAYRRVVSGMLARLSRYWLVWGPESVRARSTQESQPNEQAQQRGEQRPGHHSARLDSHDRAWIELPDHRYRS